MKIYELMSTDLVTAESSASIKATLDKMGATNYKKLPVMQDGVLVGMIVAHDIISALRRPGVVEETPVEWLMSKTLIIAHPQDNVTLAAQLLVDKKISSIPIVDGDNLVGIITVTDIINQYIKEHS